MERLHCQEISVFSSNIERNSGIFFNYSFEDVSFVCLFSFFKYVFLSFFFFLPLLLSLFRSAFEHGSFMYEVKGEGGSPEAEGPNVRVVFLLPHKIPTFFLFQEVFSWNRGRGSRPWTASARLGLSGVNSSFWVLQLSL